MLKILADVPWTGHPLQGAVGNGGWLGGSEQEVNAFTYYISKQLKRIVPVVGTTKITTDDVDSSDFYIVFNFFLLSEEVKKKLIQFGNYLIIEHDFKFCPNRQPNVYKDCIVPTDQLKNIDFYHAAKKVFCLSENQARIFNKNLPILSIEILHTSFWADSEFKLIQDCLSLRKDRPTLPIYAVYNYLHATKGTANAVDWCNKNSKLMLLMTPTDKKTFINALSLCEGLAFLPNLTESYSRIAAEARMLELDVVHNYNVSFMLESWLGKLSGLDLISKFRNELIPTALEKICSIIVTHH